MIDHVEHYVANFYPVRGAVFTMFPNNFLGVGPQAAGSVDVEGDECSGPEVSLEPDGEDADDPETELLEAVLDLVGAGGPAKLLRRPSGCDDIDEESDDGQDPVGHGELVQQQRVHDGGDV